MNRILKFLLTFTAVAAASPAMAVRGDCKFPITYEVTEVDSRFGVDFETFRQAATTAASLWNLGVGKSLVFESGASAGKIKVKMEYTDKQRVFKQLLSIKDKGESLNKWNADYQKVGDELRQIVKVLETKTIDFNQRSKNLETKIKTWNRLGPKSGYSKQQIAAERAQLQKEREQLVAMQKKYGSEIERLQKLGANLKQSSTNLSGEYTNVKAAQDRVIGFNRAGVYQRTTAGEHIKVFLYENPNKLVLTLAHEFGHALGIGHVTEPGALMNADMTKANENLSTLHRADIAKLKELCPGL